MWDLPPHQSSRPTRLTFWAGSLRPCRRIGAGIFESDIIAASWKKMPDMKIYRGSHFHGTGGCFTAW
jgi:hypothetical protein